MVLASRLASGPTEVRFPDLRAAFGPIGTAALLAAPLAAARCITRAPVAGVAAPAGRCPHAAAGSTQAATRQF
ncbi:hypothetical protein [Stappia sp. MMSF_3263]|uniref:hypothetical protein n=1 Tax=Stappia sp. MMSF_3263 TaxID=3046693 RepID=UPI00273DB0FC|nr:hypothetical protein [Stappia sp. MMSF_3263]